MTNDSFSLTAAQRWQTSIAVGVALLLLATGGYFWARARGAFQHTMTVRFVAPSALGIRSGEVVRLSGVRIGEVSDIALNVQARVDVHLDLDTRYAQWLHGNSTASVDRESLIGDDFVALTPGNDQGGPLTDGTLITFARNDSMEDAKQLPRQISSTLQEIDALATTLNDPNADLRTSLHEAHELITELRTTRTKLDTTLAGIDRLTRQRLPQTLSNLDTTLATARGSLATMDQSLTALDNHGSETLDDYRQVAADLRIQLANVQKLLDTTQPQLHELLRSSQSLVNNADAAVDAARSHWPFTSSEDAAPANTAPPAAGPVAPVTP